MFNGFKEIDSDEISSVSGGCQCTCNRNPGSTSSENFYDIGSAKSLEECSKVCKGNSWVIVKCVKDDEDDDKQKLLNKCTATSQTAASSGYIATT